MLQPQDRRSSKPGDADEAVWARHRWLARGYAAGLVETLRPLLKLDETSCENGSPRTLDLGCGEGSFGPALFENEADGYCGIDLSKRAMKLAARGWPPATWVLANADRFLPADDRSVDRVISLFGRRPLGEIRRVLRPAGICLVAVPGEDDLIELRQLVQKAGQYRSRRQAIVSEMKEADLELVQHQRWHDRMWLDADAIGDALAMTYRGRRHSEQARLKGVGDLEVTLSADVLLFRPDGGV